VRERTRTKWDSEVLLRAFLSGMFLAFLCAALVFSYFLSWTLSI